MMGKNHRSELNKIKILSASEIGQYHYCSMAWYLQKLGYKPKSDKLEIGTKKHIELGKIMDSAQIKIKVSRTLTIIGYLLLISAILITFLGVIL